MKYYHITAIKNIDAILCSGLKANDEGKIFFFENIQLILRGSIFWIRDHIAVAQVFLFTEYALFEIDSKGFNSKLINDNCRELPEKWQWFLKQKRIEPKHIRIIGIYKRKLPSPVNNVLRLLPMSIDAEQFEKQLK